jgi:predicted small lipoprotein YifL
VSCMFPHPGRLLAATGLLLLLSGCGQTGPLYLPPPESAPAKPATSTPQATEPTPVAPAPAEPAP